MTVLSKKWWELTDDDFAHLDIVSEVEIHTGVRLRKRHGQCPYPGCVSQSDGFMVWEQLTESNCHFYCRRCGKAGNIVKLVMDIKGVEWHEAYTLLQIDVSEADRKLRKPRVKSAQEIQEENRLAWLREFYPLFCSSATSHPRALAYFSQRGIPLWVVQELGIGYIPASNKDEIKKNPELWEMRLWLDRILFPLPGQQFSGRSLFLWIPGMDENEHKKLLNAFNDKWEAHNTLMDEDHGKEAWKYRKPTIPRYKVTPGGGYFRADILKDVDHATFMEGPFDVCAAYAAGIKDAIAAGTNSVKVNAIPLKICDVTLAYDGDAAGIEAAEKWSKQLRRKGIAITRITPPDDGLGSDWSERYRRAGIDGLSALLHPVVEPESSPVSEPPPAALDEASGLACADCDTAIEASDRDFFADEDGTFYCTVCRDPEQPDVRRVISFYNVKTDEQVNGGNPPISEIISEVEPPATLTPEQIQTRFLDVFRGRAEIVPAGFFDGLKERIESNDPTLVPLSLDAARSRREQSIRIDFTAQPDWTQYGSVWCEADMIVDKNGKVVVARTVAHWMLDYNCTKLKGLWVNTVGFEQVIGGKWRKALEPVNRLSHWSPPSDHQSSTSMGDNMMDLMRALDAENEAKRAALGIDSTPLVPACDEVMV